MIIVYHYNNKVDSVLDHQHQKPISFKETDVMKTMMALASSFDQIIIVWCNITCKESLNHEAIVKALNKKNMMVSYGHGFYLPDAIGYVEDSPFIKVNPLVKYPTFLTHTTVGAIHGSALLQFKDCVLGDDFAYALNSIAKLGMPNGLFCYSEPNLVVSKMPYLEKHAGFYTLFQFVKQHYRTRWIFLLALNFLWHERQLKLLPLLKSLFYKRRNFSRRFNLETVIDKEIFELPSIDVIIPTIGRASYLHDVLKDLAKQTHLPRQVIIVEQNPDPESKSALDFIYTENWPFKIDHHFIHQTGACNARNLALNQVVSEYVYLADDDNKFDVDLIETVLHQMLNFDLDVVSMSYLQKNEVEQKKQPIQWPTFGAGCSIMKSHYLDTVSFYRALEFGYGEDVDFGMQLRNVGADIIYFPNIQILHLKAPIGGFRSTFQHPWSNDELQPKPSPTVMLNRMSNRTKQQVLGYKTILCINYYFVQRVKNPFCYFKRFNKQWERSEDWANILILKNP